MKNPFNPRFGRKPESFLERSDITYNLLSSYDEPNAPENTTLITGVRGSGKTVMLADIYEQMKDNSDWVVIYTACNDDILSNIIELIDYELGRKKSAAKIDSVSVKSPFGAVNIKNVEKKYNTFYLNLRDALDVLSDKELRLLIIVDEVSNSKAMKDLGQTYQLLYGSGYEINFLFAGLPHEVDSLINAKTMTFLHRATHILLPSIDTYYVKIAYESEFRKRGCHFEESALELAYLSTSGYPYLYQLLGYNLWKNINDDTIRLADVEGAIEISKAALFQNVYSILYRDLSEKDQIFLLAMNHFEKNVNVRSITNHLNQKENLTHVYKNRLLRVGIIENVSRGVISFSLPFFSEFLKEQKKLLDF